MGLGILEPSRVDNVPGTVFIYDDASRPMQDGRFGSRRMKYDRNGVILVPQPSDDPNDPLVRERELPNRNIPILMEVELAAMEARLHRRNLVNPVGHRLYIESSACGKHCHTSITLR